MPIKPLFPFRKMKEPVFYRMTCPKCGFDKQYELEKADTVYNDPDGAAPKPSVRQMKTGGGSAIFLSTYLNSSKKLPGLV